MIDSNELRKIVRKAPIINTADYMRAVREFFYTRFSSTGSYNQQLFRLIQKADQWNRAKLRISYPTEVSVVSDWEASETEKDFFNLYVPDLVKNFNI